MTLISISLTASVNCTFSKTKKSSPLHCNGSYTMAIVIEKRDNLPLQQNNAYSFTGQQSSHRLLKYESWTLMKNVSPLIAFHFCQRYPHNGNVCLKTLRQTSYNTSWKILRLVKLTKLLQTLQMWKICHARYEK